MTEPDRERKSKEDRHRERQNMTEPDRERKSKEDRHRERQNMAESDREQKSKEDRHRERQNMAQRDRIQKSKEDRERQNMAQQGRERQNKVGRNREQQNMAQQNEGRQNREFQKENRQHENRSSIDWQDEDWQEEGWTEAEWLEEKKREEERQRRRRQRIAEMKREKHRREMMFRYGVPGVAAVMILCVILLVAGILKGLRPKEDEDAGGEDHAGTLTAQGDISGGTEDGQEQLLMIQKALSTVLQQTQFGYLQTAGTVQTDLGSSVGTMLAEAPRQVFEAHTTESTNGFSDNIISDYGIIIDVESGEVLAQKGGWSRINPASMTKILTVLVAAEHITDLDDTFTMTIEITDYSFLNGCSNTGFEVGEEIPLKDLFYGTVLPSGADAALGLAVYVAGSQEAFVDMMNAKLEELGLSETTHFTNCIGLYDENHYSTPYDMAVILKEAADNEFCRQVLSEHYYVTTSTAEHPEGIGISNWFLRRIEDRDTHGEVLCAKTGFVDQSKSCAASLAADHSGKEYICVTAGSTSNMTCIRDHVELYQRYLPE